MSNNTNNVIPFPVKNERFILPDVIGNPEAPTLTESLSITLCSYILEQIKIYGYDVDLGRSDKNIILMLESINSFMKASEGKHHPLQDFAEQHIEITSDGVSFK